MVPSWVASLEGAYLLEDAGGVSLVHEMVVELQNLALEVDQEELAFLEAS